MKTNRRKRKNTCAFGNTIVKGKGTIKKVKVEESSTGHASSIEVIDLSDSEESKNSSQQKQLINEHKPNDKKVKLKNFKQNDFETNAISINQLLQLDGNVTYEEVDMQDNPNEIFFCEDFHLDDPDTTECNNEQPIKTEESSKFYGISKLARARCCTCKKNLENVNDNQLRFLRSCPQCQSPLLFQCLRCCTFYKYFQSVWDHVHRDCKKAVSDSRLTIAELALKIANERGDPDGDQPPPLIILDSDIDDECNENIISSTNTFPFRIQSVESSTKFEEPDDVSNKTRSGEDASLGEIEDGDLSESQDDMTELQGFESSCEPRNTPQGKLYFQCYKCEFQAESSKEMQRHIAYEHYMRFESNGFICWNCKKHFKSKELRDKHEIECCGKYSYICKFCPRIAKSLFAMKKHITTSHSKLFKQNELEGIIEEIKCQKKPAIETSENIAGKVKRTTNSYPIMGANEAMGTGKKNNYSKINELLKIRCCNCKVTFDRVEPKEIARCPTCLSELLYSCRKCTKFFAYFGKAWIHVNRQCFEITKNTISINAPTTRLATKKAKAAEKKAAAKKKKAATKKKKAANPRLLKANYKCRYCKFAATHEWQISQHEELKHSCLNGDLAAKFTACSRCGLAFANSEECKLHEQQYCGKEMYLVCEFCPRVEARVEPMRIHLLKMHIEQLGSLSNLENVINAIKLRRQATRGTRLRALPVPNK